MSEALVQGPRTSHRFTRIGIALVITGLIGYLAGWTVAGGNPLLGGSVPRGARPTRASGEPLSGQAIRHVVIIVKENHSYDNYFSSLERSLAPPLPHCTSFVRQDRCQYFRSD